MHLSVLRTVPEMGAEPVVMARTRPPRAAWTALNTSLSHILLFRITPLGNTGQDGWLKAVAREQWITTIEIYWMDWLDCTAVQHTASTVITQSTQ